MTSHPLGRLPGPLPWSVIDEPNLPTCVLDAKGNYLWTIPHGGVSEATSFIVWINETAAQLAAKDAERAELLSKLWGSDAANAELRAQLAAATLRIESAEKVIRPLAEFALLIEREAPGYSHLIRAVCSWLAPAKGEGE